MASSNAVWGIEIGQCALKAIKLRPAAEEGKVELVAFDVIEHPKILSQPDADPDELIAAALEKFTSRNDWQNDGFVVGVPGQQTFARFCKLPPVESKKIPEIVQFEATQQIPFDINDMVWDYQVFEAEDAPDVEVGIFAMRKDLVRKHLEHFTRFNITPLAIQTIPSALYNFCRYDAERDIEEGTATIVIDVGAQHTDLIVVEPHSAWSRNIPLGGNSFTEALVKAFKLTFEKAEALKRTAATSKYARQVFQAMRPVFADLVAEIQRSIGFFSSTHRDVELKRVLACGNAFLLPGLLKYLENNLTIAGGVSRLESFEAVVTAGASDAEKFSDNVLSLGPAYGLALQGLGLATIRANLLPPELARVQAWRRKQPWFMGAAACLAAAAVMPFLRIGIDRSALERNQELVGQIQRIVNQAKQYQAEYKKVATDTTGQLEQINKLFELEKDKDVIPRVIWLVHEALPKIDPALAAARTPEELKKLIESDPQRFKRTKRRQMIIEHLDIRYSGNIDALEVDRTQAAESKTYATGAPGLGGRMGRPGRMGMGPAFGGGGGAVEETAEAPGFFVSIQGRLLYGERQSEAVSLIEEDFYPRLRELGRTPGLGFYIPEKDEKNVSDPDNRNLARPWVVQYMGTRRSGGFAARGGGGGVRGAGMGMGAGGRMAGGRMMGAMPGMGMAQPGEEGEPSVQFPDPVTGEDMATDWTFRLGFKIKIGEPPAEAGEDQKPQ